MPIAELIAPEHGDWPGPFVEDEIFGSHEAEAVERQFVAFCRAELGATPAAAVFYEVSVGSVAGVQLADGRRVVVKAHRPNVPADSLRAAQHVQRTLVERGFPCPRPLLEPRPLGGGVGTVEELIDEGDRRDARAQRSPRVGGDARAATSGDGRRLGADSGAAVGAPLLPGWPGPALAGAS